MLSSLAFLQAAITAFTAFPRANLMVARQLGYQLPWMSKTC